MLEKLKNLKSYEVFKLFKEMNTIPRGSGNEKQVSDWLVKFAQDRGLECIQDETLNVIIRKPGTPGYENSATVVIQGHMDMVCEKNTDTVHDFEKDPIAFIVEGDFLRADGTTLGADDGIAVAFGLAVLDSNDIPHPPIELLVTSDEEAGMGGAQGLDPKNITGKRLINIDSEEEGILLVSCAGGVREIITLDIEKEKVEGKKAYALEVKGLKGGHSGMEINKERGNANKLMGRFLYELSKVMELNIAEINGGAKMNAITRECNAVVLINEKDATLLSEKANEWNANFKIELNAQDPNVELSAKAVEAPEAMFTKESTEKVIDVLYLIPNGIHTMSIAIEGLVESSTNLGVVETVGNSVNFESCVRSSVKTLKDEITAKGALISKLVGAKMQLISDYPAWEYNPESELRETFVEVFENLYGKKPEISAIHAGLECGLFGGKFGSDMDMISFGPNIYDVHTPKEHVSISSTDRMYDYLLNILKKLK